MRGEERRAKAEVKGFPVRSSDDDAGSQQVLEKQCK